MSINGKKQFSKMSIHEKINFRGCCEMLENSMKLYNKMCFIARGGDSERYRKAEMKYMNYISDIRNYMIVNNIKM